MRPNDTITERLWNIVEPVCGASDYELLDLVLSQSPTGWVLRVFIDHDATAASHASTVGDADIEEATHQEPPPAPVPDGSAISFADSEDISRELSAILDVEDPISHPYNLEVSSPGLDRPLRKPEHFRRYLGQVAKVSLHDGIDGRRNFKGTLLALTDSEGRSEKIAIDVDGTEYQLPFNDIKTARLVPDWNALFRPGQSGTKAR